MTHLRKALAAALSGFVIWTAAFGQFSSLVQRAAFVELVILLGLATYPLLAGSRWRPLGIAIDGALAICATAACLTILRRADDIMSSLPFAEISDIALTVILIVVILEVARRAIGLIFPVLVLAGLAYALLGQFIPGRFGHRGFDIYFVTETLFLGDLGFWGLLTGVAATTLAAFTLFGALLLHSGGGDAFMKLSMRIGGRTTGGAAKIATIASGLFGMISGSSVANVATTGAFTIPMMKRLGYPRPFAGAVEAVASTGGQLAPPIMGAAAFIMAEILGVSYFTIAAAAALPAALFYAGVFVTVHSMAAANGLGAVPREELPSWREALNPSRLAPVVVAFAGLTYGLVNGRSLQSSAFFAMAGVIIVSILMAVVEKRLAGWLHAMMDAVEDAGRGLVIVGILLAGAQILVAMINLTGLGVTLSSMLATIGGGVLVLGFVVAATCMVMGMGIPTTAAYVLVASVLAPAMIRAGVEPLTAHMFVFYYATLSVITPPVCVAVFVAASLADTRWPAVARRALAIGASAYGLPFLFLLIPATLSPSLSVAYLHAIVAGAVFILATAAMFGGWSIFGRRHVDIACWIAIALGGLAPHWTLTTISAVALLAIIARDFIGTRRQFPDVPVGR